MEVSGLTEHLLEDCDSQADYKQCPRCSEAISVKVYAKHTRDHVCSRKTLTSIEIHFYSVPVHKMFAVFYLLKQEMFQLFFVLLVPTL